MAALFLVLTGWGASSSHPAAAALPPEQWVPQAVPPGTGDLKAVSCATVSVCYAVGLAGTILATNDGGYSGWRSQSGGQGELDGISCVTVDVCFAGGAGGIFQTSDGGSTAWTNSTSRPVTAIDCHLPSASGPARCTAVGPGGTVLVTTDGGNSWSNANSGISLDLKSIWCSDGGNPCVAVGGQDHVSPGEDSRLVGGAIITSNDGGTTWAIGVSNDAPSVLSGVGCAGARCVAVGAQDASGRGVILGGAPPGAGGIALPQVWQVQTLGVQSPLYGASAITGMQTVVGGSGTIMHDSSPSNVGGGSTWASVDSGTQSALHGVSCVLGYRGGAAIRPCFAVGDAGSIVALLATPTITNVNPSSGATAGGTQVTITGTGFTPDSTVTFGGSSANGVTVSSPTKLVAVTPGGSGSVPVQVSSAAGWSGYGNFTYQDVLPMVTGVSPSSGPSSGGTQVTITGQGFSGASAINIGPNSASGTPISDSQISATTPSGGGTVVVTVTTAIGTSDTTPTSGNQFTYAGTPAAVAPGAPIIGTASAGNAQATVSFSPPASDGGSPITSYAATASPGGFTTSGSASPITVTGLANGTTYTLTVTATNSVGTGPASGASNPVTPATVPGAPTDVVAVAGDGNATVSFKQPNDNGGAPITSFTATSNPGAVTAAGRTSPLTIAGLTNGTTYTFTVTASNSAGTGPPSGASNAVTPRIATTPGPPVIGTATAGDGQAAVSFGPPADDGGKPITGYTVTSSPGSMTATHAGSPITVSGLTNGTRYTFTVTAANEVGNGRPSGASNSVVPEPDYAPHVGWSAQPLPAGLDGVAIRSISCPSPRVCFAVGTDFVGRAHMLRTLDGGINGWTDADVGSTSNPSPAGISCPTVTNCMAAGGFGIVSTSDGGDSWTGSAPLPGGATAISCPSVNTCFVVGYGGLIMTTADGGATWRAQTSGTTGSLFGISCTSTTRCAAVGDGPTPVGPQGGGVITTTVDGGTTWASQSDNGLPGSLHGVSCVVAGLVTQCVAVGAAGGGAGTIVEYSDGPGPASGKWLPEVSGSPARLSGVTCGPDGCLAVGDAGTILSGARVPANDQQRAWSPEISGTTTDLYGASCPAVRSCFAVGGGNGPLGGGPTVLFAGVPPPPAPPGAPVVGSAVAGAGNATVSFRAPSTDGGNAITAYTVTASPGGKAASGSESPITVPGLTNGTAYTLTVTARNGVGTGQPSGASNVVTPNASPRLSVVKAGSGSGSVISKPAGIDCGLTCAQSFTASASITLTAAPASGSTFAGWSGSGCSGTGTCVVVMTAEMSVTATFNGATHAIGVIKVGQGNGIVASDPAGIDCGASCLQLYPSGTSVTLVAEAATSSIFLGWSGGGCTGTGICTVVADSDKNVVATFRVPLITLGQASAVYFKDVTLGAGPTRLAPLDGGEGICDAGPVTTTGYSSTTGSGTACTGALGGIAGVTADGNRESVLTQAASCLGSCSHSTVASFHLIGANGLDLIDATGLDAESSTSCSAAPANRSSILRLAVAGSTVATQPVGSRIVFNPTGRNPVTLYGNPIWINPTGSRIPLAIVTLNYSSSSGPTSGAALQTSSAAEVEFPAGGPLASVIVGKVFLSYARTGVQGCGQGY